MLNHKGYLGRLRVDLDAGVIRGKVINTRDTITFQGKTVEEATQAFRDSVEDYLEFCGSTGEPPEKPFSGKFVVRIRPELHRDLSALAQSRGTSLNRFIASQLSGLTGGEPVAADRSGVSRMATRVEQGAVTAANEETGRARSDRGKAIKRAAAKKEAEGSR
jgi:predicted HicB family RNase H-like nuclease